MSSPEEVVDARHNVTDRPIIRGDTSRLRAQVRAALDVAERLVDEQFAGKAARGRTAHAGNAEGFRRFLGAGNAGSVEPDERFVQLLFDLAQGDSQNTGVTSILKQLKPYVCRNTVAATSLSTLKRGVRLALVELWRGGTLLLPTVFTPGPYFATHLFQHELLEWVLSIASRPRTEIPGRPSVKRRPLAAGEHALIEAGGAQRLHHLGPRIIWTADWQTPEDVSLIEYSTLHHAWTLYRHGAHPYVISGSPFPWTLLLSHLQRSFPDRVEFDVADLDRYSSWALSGSVSHSDFGSFVPRKRAARVRKKATYKPKRPAAERHDEEVRKQVTSAQTHEAAILIFRRLGSDRPPSTRWKDGGTPTYPGREHVDVASLSEKWLQTFRGYLSYRETVEGYRESHGVVSALTLLADYLFFYLPWWRDFNPDAQLPVPTAPRHLSRYLFVQRHERGGSEILPKTLLELLNERRPSKYAAYNAVQHLTRYFRFVATHYADDEAIAGAGFKSPLDHEFDAPRLPRKHKTTKEVIPKNLYGHLLFYAYAVEHFGNYLVQRALAGELERLRPLLHSQWILDTQALGYVPIMRYRGRQFPVRSVPNVFPISKRRLASGVVGPAEAVCEIPHATVLRLLIASLETGLRCQSVQWLDRFTWDSLNGKADPSAYTYALLVNTDKTKTKPWVTSIVYRVRNLLLRENEYQKLFADADAHGPVAYEGLDASPFDPIHPLFRGAGAGPVSDSRYFEAWKRLLVGFEIFYREASGERHVRLCHTGAQRTPDGAPVIKQQENGAPYCALTLTTTYTPHSCRATFATNRQGVLELGDVADLLGHENIVTTAHYTKPSTDQLRERLQAVDLAIIRDYELFDPTTAVSSYIRADKPESAVVKGFLKDREGAIRTLGFMPPMALWSAEGDMASQDGMELLRSGPMSRIRFRETHVCPLNEECSIEIVQMIGAPRRCGSCPVAMKSVDHLPAIAAKQNQLLERIQFLHAKRLNMERAQEPAAAVDAMWDEMELDVNELLGWKFSEEVLSVILTRACEQSEGAPMSLHADSPDIVRRHLERVTRKCSQSEFILQRLAESNAYPSMASEKVQVMASALRRQLLAGQQLDQFAADGGQDDIRSVGKMLAVMMKAEQIDIQELAKRLEAPIGKVKPLMLRTGTDGE